MQTFTASEQQFTAGNLPQLATAPESGSPESFPTPWPRRALRFARRSVVVPTQAGCLIVLLAAASAVPILQLAVLGYLLELTGRIARGKSLADSFQLLPQATTIGLAMAAVYLWTLPIGLLGYYVYVAELIEAGNPLAERYRIASIAVVVLAFCHLSWAWLRGGKLVHYLWPQPIRLLKQIWRPRTWEAAADRMWAFLLSLRVPSLIWLGLRGAVGVLAWIIIPAILLIATARSGETVVAGIVGTIGFLWMGWVLMYLPMLQAQFATDNRLRSMFAWRTVRGHFYNAPIAFWLGTSATLMFAIPLYLLKIEPTPKELVWLPAIFFIAFMLPAHMLTGWAMRRSIRHEFSNAPRRNRWWHRLVRLTCRLLTLPVVFTYLFFVYLSQLTSWDGLDTWLQQHAFLVPVPFVGT